LFESEAFHGSGVEDPTSCAPGNLAALALSCGGERLIALCRRSGDMSIPSFVYEMKTVFLSTIHVSGSSKPPIEIIRGETGALALAAYKQNSQGKQTVNVGGWNQVKNMPPSSVGP
jgi:hypothetical protein